MSKKNNTPEQKLAWKANRKLGSKFVVDGRAVNWNFPKKTYDSVGNRLT